MVGIGVMGSWEMKGTKVGERSKGSMWTGRSLDRGII